MHRLLHHGGAAFVLQAEVVPHVQHAHHIVGAALAHGIAGVAAGADGAVPFLLPVLRPEQLHLGAVGGDLAGGAVVELEHVLDELLFGAVDDPLFAALVHHHADLLLADGLLVGIGVHPQQAQHAVGGGGEQPDDGGEGPGDGAEQGGHAQGQGLGLAHGQPLGHQLAKDQREVGEHQRDEHHGHRVQRGGGHRHAQAQEPGDQPVGEVFGREGTAQKAGQGDGHLDGGQKTGGLAGEAGKAGGPLVAGGGQPRQASVIHGDDGDLGAGEHGIEADEGRLKQEHESKGIFQSNVPP